MSVIGRAAFLRDRRGREECCNPLVGVRARDLDRFPVSVSALVMRFEPSLVPDDCFDGMIDDLRAFCGAGTNVFWPQALLQTLLLTQKSSGTIAGCGSWHIQFSAPRMGR